MERFDDNFLTSSVDVPSTLYFTKERLNELVDPKNKFAQEILSANPLYVIETYSEDQNNSDCNGKFTYDGNTTLTIEWVDNYTPREESGVYINSNGNVITSHGQKAKTETIETISEDVITTIKTVLHEDGSTDGTGNIKRW